MDRIIDEITKYCSTTLGFGELRKPRVDRDLSTFDLAFPIHEKVPKGKGPEVQAAVKALGEQVQATFEKNPHPLITSIDTAGNGFLNISLNHAAVFKIAAEAIQAAGDNYGKSDKMKGKKAIVEHTSTNPNSTIHVGNLRCTIVGAFVANLLRAVGYDVKEWFYVDDLGGQIGLTYVGFREVYPIVKPSLKIDLWIGMIYAVSNTMNEFQMLGWKLKDAAAAIENGTFQTVLVDPITDPKKKAQAENMIGIYQRQKVRVPELVDALVDKLNDINIRDSSREWNLRYEHADAEAVRGYRQMVNLCLSGQQETLDVYGIHHDKFFYESTLCWDGSNDAVAAALKATPYFVDRTQCNAQGVPEGGYLNLDKFLQDSGLPYGGKGYQKNYPKFYLIRDDGSTLYSFRDIAFSMHKCQNVDYVLTGVCSEQNLAQEKVQLALRMLAPDIAEKQWHLSYDLVRLVDRRMKGREGVYVTADEVYQDLKAATRDIIRKRSMQTKEDEEKDEKSGNDESAAAESSSSTSSAILSQPSIGSLDMSEEELERVTHEVASASMKYTLLACSLHTELTFNVSKATDPNEASAPFLLYNYARLCSLLDKFDRIASESSSSASSESAVLPLCPLSEVDWSVLPALPEWRLLLRYVLQLPSLVEEIALPTLPTRPALPVFPVNRLPEFLIGFVRDFSSFYKATRIIVPGDVKGTHARIWFVKMIKQVLHNGLKLMLINPVERM